MSSIKTSKSLVDDAVRQLYRYQSGEETPIVTSYDHFNEMTMGGLYKQNIVVVSARSGVGKSYFVQQIESDIFNKELNPNTDAVLLRCNWEMSVMKLLTRQIAKSTDKSYKEVLTKKPDEKSATQYKAVCDKERNPNIFYIDLPLTPDVFEGDVGAFLEEHKDRDHIVVTIDHIGLVKASGSKKEAIDYLIEAINRLRNKYTNVSYVILMQMNRSIEERTEVKDAAPRTSDLMSSDTVLQIADTVIALNIPYKLGFDRYMVVSGIKKDNHGREINSRYSHLEEYMISPSNKMTNFKTLMDDNTSPLLFYHYLKVRDGLDLSTYKDLFIHPIQ